MVVAGLAVVAAPAFGQAAGKVSDDVVRIGVLNDQSGLYADNTGQGSVVAARMAVEDHGGDVLGKPAAAVFAAHPNKADIGSHHTPRLSDPGVVDVHAHVCNSPLAPHRTSPG